MTFYFITNFFLTDKKPAQLLLSQSLLKHEAWALLVYMAHKWSDWRKGHFAVQLLLCTTYFNISRVLRQLRVRFEIGVYDIWSGKSGSEVGFSPNTSVFPCQCRLTPNDPYMGLTAPLTSKLYILYIYSTNTGTEYFKHALYSPFLFHNANLFGSCIIHI